MKLQDISSEIWRQNYRAPKEKTQKDTWERQARAASAVEKKSLQEQVYQDFLWLFTDYKAMAGGRITANLGVEGRNGTTLMNCYVINPKDTNYQDPDSIHGIYDALKEQALTLKSEGGYGMNFSWIRPRGMYVNGIGSRTPGVVKFMELWDKSSEIITMGSDTILGEKREDEKLKIRKGAQMGILEIWHPEIEGFIDAKLTEGRLDKFNISVGITPGFMEAVQKDKTWNLKFPNTEFEKYKTEWNGNIEEWESKDYPVTVFKRVKAKELWEKITKATYTRNDPGVLFLDIANKYNPFSYGEVIATTNPCITGETLVAVADGVRDNVSIKELASEGKDVPVYCLDNNNKISIRVMRNPRYTGTKKVYKITLEGGETIKATENHKFKTSEGDYKEVKDLIVGDGLRTMTKFEASIKDVFPTANSNSQDYVWINNNDNKLSNCEHRLIYEFNSNSDIEKGMVIHHKDYNAKNNHISNLEKMTKKDHDVLHSKDMMGKNNPMIRWYQNASPEEKQRYHDNMSASVSGTSNGRYSGFTNEQLKEHALKLTEQCGKLFSHSEWTEYAKKNNLPQHFTKWREDHLGGITGLSRWAANKLGYHVVDGVTTKILKTYKEALDQEYDAEIINNRVMIHKKCEYCGDNFTIGYIRREQGVCSALCGQMLSHKNRKQSIKEEQLNIYTKLKFNLDREPQKKEWILECKNNEVSPEISRKSSPFRSWKELKESSVSFNHRIISIEEDGIEDVYNGTVDEFHNFFIGGFEGKTETGKRKSLYFNNLQCGEIGMSTGVCNLLSVNLVKFIIKNEDGNYYFDFDGFRKAIKISVRFSDNINDISNTPLESYKKSMTDKRRIGIGVLGLGSLHCILGIKFGSPESLKLIEEIFKCKAETEILASAKLGKEKGSFKLFDREQYFNTFWWNNLPISQDVKDEVQRIGYMRNSHRSANAPTGNMSVYAGVLSGGIEPMIFLEYIRWSIVPEQERAKLKEKGFKFPEVHEGQWGETKHMKLIKKGTDEVLEGSFDGVDYEVDKNRGLVKGTLVEDYGWKYVKENFSEEKINEYRERGAFTTSEELSVQEHINTLEVIAKYVDMNSSKTINVPKDYSYEDFEKVYMDAWKAGIKGITTYRAGTMTAVLEKKEEIKEKRNELEQTFDEANGHVIMDKMKLPDEYYSKGYIVRDNNGKKWYVNIAFANQACTKPFAFFVSTNNKESSEVADDTIQDMIKLARSKGLKKHVIDNHWEKCQYQTNVTKIARTIGFCLRHNIKMVDVVNVLSDEKKYPFSSFTFHLTRLLKQFIKDGTEVSGNKGKCRKCAGQVIYQEGCFVCRDCGYSKCG